MFYVAGSAQYGTVVLTTASGSQAAESAQKDLKRWTDRLTPAERHAIMTRRYGNTKDALDKFRESNPEQAEQLFPDDVSRLSAADFNTKGFLVRPEPAMLLQQASYKVIKVT